MNDSQRENISHLLDHVEDRLFKLSDILETELEDGETYKKLDALLIKVGNEINEIKDWLY
ncbi:hypothetical protein P4V41_07845 [Fictibacillus nanhaiensis]|uniref:hypothetical protein n=1 Tax=Fictibacillus nanhaiensis TaxID=742169 RepID=UPI002E1CAF0F|nr:hypothetical protein [Fictibacillus nanhaiensis]